MSALAPPPLPDHADDDATSADDARLLGAYIEHRSQSAFAELVRRHTRLVYGVALRHSGQPHTAEEIAPKVFIELSRQAARLHPQTVLPAWLHTVAHRRAIDAGRAEARRRRREDAACILSEPAPAPPYAPADEAAIIAPLLDAALARLPTSERAAVLLRFFEHKSLA